MRQKLLIVIMSLVVNACSGVKELKTAITGANLSETDNLKDSEHQPIKTPLPTPITEQPNQNSLWQPGARSFFKDQRASQPGDILTVSIDINDSASMNNTSSKSRTSQNNSVISKLAGAETGLKKYFPGISPPTIFDTKSSPSHSGSGTINRSEKVNLEVAAMVVELLSNGNLFIKGEQEVLVNSELRKLYVSGIISRADIEPGNIVSSRRISQARIYYGGEGEVNDVQQDKWGNKVIEAIMPF